MTYYERKALLPHGAQTQVATLLNCDAAKVSRVMRGYQRDADVERELHKLARNRRTGKRPTLAAMFGPLTASTPTGAK